MKIKVLFLVIILGNLGYAQYDFEQIDVWSGSNGGSAKYLTQYNGAMYFQAAEITPSFKKLYKTDGTLSGTVQVATNLNAGAGYSPESFTVFNGQLFFTAQVSGLGIELYKTDGTEAGTLLVKDIRAGSSNGLDQNTNNDKQLFVEFNGELYFRGSTNSSIELWKTDGTETGTVSVKNFEATQTGAPVYVTNNEHEYLGVVFNNELYFVVNRSGDYELWKTDGSTAGTVIVRNGFSNISNLIVFNNQLFFSATDVGSGNEIWVSDGTSIGTQLKHDIFPNNLNPSLGLGSSPDDFIIFNNEMFFTARGYDDLNNNVIGRELYKTDGALSSLVKNINTTISGSNVERSGLSMPKFKIFNNQLYFIANNDVNGTYGLWVTTGTESGTVEVVSPNDTGVSFQFLNATEYNNALFYFNNQQLWVTNGTLSGTKILTDINGVNSDILQAQSGALINFSNKLWFEGLSNSNGSELTSLVDNTLSNVKVEGFLEVKLYPNPSKSIINISGNSEIYNIKVFNCLGQKVGETSGRTIDVSSLPIGQYVVKFQTNGGTLTKKIIKI